MSSTDCEAFSAARRAAAKAYVSGDGSAVDALVPHEGEATFMSPLGDVVTGARETARRYLENSRTLHPEGRTDFEVLQRAQSGDLALWPGYEVADVQIGSMPDRKDMRIRVTEVFRRIGGEWKLVHRQADNQEVVVKTPPTLND